MGYWLGRKFWGHGYATIAARMLINHIFATTDLYRIYAHHFIGNEASGRVMEKVGMRREGLIRGGTCKNGVNRDVILYAIVRGDPVF
jgi:RimJ/RimL family protein N-acetyltransferase